MKLGVTLFSLTLEWLSGRYSIADMLAELRRRDVGPGIEIVGFQSIRDFPSISKEFALDLRRTFDAQGFAPTCLGANVDLALRRDRKLTDDETVDYLAAQIAAAETLGFPVLRVQMNAKPDVLRRLVPIAERARIALGMELHSPYSVHHPAVIELRDLYEKMQSPALAFIPDLGVSMLRIPPGLIETFRASDTPEETIGTLQEIWKSSLPTHEKFARLRTKATAQGATDQQIGNMNLALSMFGMQPLEDWAEILDYVVHIHGKFYGFDEAGDESSMDLARALQVFVKGGFAGSLSSEWEGHAYTDAVSGFDMVEKHQALCRRILNQMPL
jgi:hypothetical protein